MSQHLRTGEPDRPFMPDGYEWSEPPTFFSATRANPTPPPVNGAFAWGVRLFLIGIALIALL